MVPLSDREVMATKKKDPKDLKKVGAKTEYKPEYCAQLIEHMKKGFSFASFGSVVSKSEQTLHNWKDAHPEFLEAKNVGLVFSLRLYEEMGQKIALGQIRTIVSEEPVMYKGKPVIDPQTGAVLMKRLYKPAHASATAWKFIMKNMHDYRENIFMMGDKDNPIAIRRVDELTPQEKLKEIREMTKALQELGDDEIIDITPVQSK